jgi:ribonuclease BN (tRNA processing enzyme)
VRFACSGDTRWSPALAEAARGADLFAVEAYPFDRPIRYHLDYQTLRAHAAEIHAERVVLTHMPAAMLGRLADAELPGSLRRHGHRPLTQQPRLRSPTGSASSIAAGSARLLPD